MKWFLPPALVTTCLILMAVLSNLLPLSPLFTDPLLTLFGLTLILIGAAMVILIAYSFHKVDTNIHPFKDPDKLITTGLFKRTRNPIYLGFLLILIGAALLFNSVSTLIGPVLFFLAANFWYIPFEENAAAKQFGDDYKDYKGKVRRWF